MGKKFDIAIKKEFHVTGKATMHARFHFQLFKSVVRMFHIHKRYDEHMFILVDQSRHFFLVHFIPGLTNDNEAVYTECFLKYGMLYIS